MSLFRGHYITNVWCYLIGPLQFSTLPVTLLHLRYILYCNMSFRAQFLLSILLLRFRFCPPCRWQSFVFSTCHNEEQARFGPFLATCVVRKQDYFVLIYVPFKIFSAVVYFCDELYMLESDTSVIFHVYLFNISLISWDFSWYLLCWKQCYLALENYLIASLTLLHQPFYQLKLLLIIQIDFLKTISRGLSLWNSNHRIFWRIIKSRKFG